MIHPILFWGTLSPGGERDEPTRFSYVFQLPNYSTALLYEAINECILILIKYNGNFEFYSKGI